MKNMRVLFQCRPNLFKLSGGDKIQILNTKKYLEDMGVEIVISTTNNPDLENVDILHLFNPSLLSLNPVTTAKKRNTPIVISTIHWDMKEYYESIFNINKEYLKLKPNKYLISYFKNQLSAVIYNFWWYQKNCRDIKRIFELGDLLLPNSQAEVVLIKKQFNLSNKKYSVIPNAIDTNINATPDLFYKKYKIKNFILCAGRIEYRKNQFLLLKSMINTKQPVIFIGNNKFNPGYTRLCMKIAEKRPGKVIFIEHMGQAELYSAYCNARVHALPSWYETPGLANLEAGYFGCNLAVSDRGCTKEYFGDLAEYCDPTNITSIQKTILKAYNKPQTCELKKLIQEKYTWKQTAEKTLIAYNSLLSQP